MTRGRTREVRGPDSFERGFVGVIIVVVAALAIGFGLQLMRMVQTISAVSLATAPEADAIVYHTVNGHWPPVNAPGTMTPSPPGRYVRSLALDEGGAITAEVALDPMPFGKADSARDRIHGLVSFRPMQLGPRDAPTFSYLCGYAKPVHAPAVVSGTNKTSLARKYLPSFCR